MAARFKQNHGQGKPKADNKTKDVECWNCQRKGHIQKDCWKKGGGKEGQGPKQKKSKQKEGGADAKQASSSNQEHCFKAVAHDAVVAAPSRAGIVSRLVDSGASYYFETDRANFIEIKPCAPLPIVIGTGKTVYETSTTHHPSLLRSFQLVNSGVKDSPSPTRLKASQNSGSEMGRCS